MPDNLETIIASSFKRKEAGANRIVKEIAFYNKNHGEGSYSYDGNLKRWRLNQPFYQNKIKLEEMVEKNQVLKENLTEIREKLKEIEEKEVQNEKKVSQLEKSLAKEREKIIKLESELSAVKEILPTLQISSSLQEIITKKAKLNVLLGNARNKLDPSLKNVLNLLLESQKKIVMASKENDEFAQEQLKILKDNLQVSLGKDELENICQSQIEITKLEKQLENLQEQGLKAYIEVLPKQN